MKKEDNNQPSKIVVFLGNILEKINPKVGTILAIVILLGGVMVTSYITEPIIDSQRIAYHKHEGTDTDAPLSNDIHSLITGESNTRTQGKTKAEKEAEKQAEKQQSDNLADNNSQQSQNQCPTIIPSFNFTTLTKMLSDSSQVNNYVGCKLYVEGVFIVQHPRTGKIMIQSQGYYNTPVVNGEQLREYTLHKVNLILTLVQGGAAPQFKFEQAKDLERIESVSINNVVTNRSIVTNRTSPLLIRGYKYVDPSDNTSIYITNYNEPLSTGNYYQVMHRTKDERDYALQYLPEEEGGAVIIRLSENGYIEAMSPDYNGER